MSTKEFVDNIIGGNSNKAMNVFNDLLNSKLSDALNSRKIEIANSVYNGIEEIGNEFQRTEKESD